MGHQVLIYKKVAIKVTQKPTNVVRLNLSNKKKKADSQWVTITRKLNHYPRKPLQRAKFTLRTKKPIIKFGSVIVAKTYQILMQHLRT